MICRALNSIRGMDRLHIRIKNAFLSIGPVGWLKITQTFSLLAVIWGMRACTDATIYHLLSQMG
jgi:hypothetical protein